MDSLQSHQPLTAFGHLKQNIMITLATLEQATAQQVFDQVAKHLLQQNHKSLSESGTCSYRGVEGLKCAVGCLMSDEEYRDRFEGVNWLSIVLGNAAPSAHLPLICRLQSVHDRYRPNAWPSRLKEVAAGFNLSSEVVDANP